MDPTEIVIGEPKRVGRLQIFPLLAESVCEPRHAAHSHPDRKVLAFNVRGTDEIGIRVSHDDFWDRIHNLSGAVPLLAVRRGGIDLNQLCEVNALIQEHRLGRAPSR